MPEPKQKLIDQQMLAQLDTLRKSGAMNMGESNWYEARRGAMNAVQEGADSGSDTATTVAARSLSRLERKTIEKILSSHGMMPPASGA